MTILNPAPTDRLLGDRGRPYFLWDSEMTLEEFRARLANGSRAVQAYLTGS